MVPIGHGPLMHALYSSLLLDITRHRRPCLTREQLVSYISYIPSSHRRHFVKVLLAYLTKRHRLQHQRQYRRAQSAAQCIGHSIAIAHNAISLGSQATNSSSCESIQSVIDDNNNSQPSSSFTCLDNNGSNIASSSPMVSVIPRIDNQQQRNTAKGRSASLFSRATPPQPNLRRCSLPSTSSSLQNSVITPNQKTAVNKCSACNVRRCYASNPFSIDENQNHFPVRRQCYETNHTWLPPQQSSNPQESPVINSHCERRCSCVGGHGECFPPVRLSRPWDRARCVRDVRKTNCWHCCCAQDPDSPADVDGSSPVAAAVSAASSAPVHAGQCQLSAVLFFHCNQWFMYVTLHLIFLVASLFAHFP